MTDTHAIHTIGSLAEHKGGPTRVVVGLCTALVDAGVATDLISGTTAQDGALLLPGDNVLRTRLVPGQRRFGITRFPGFGAEIDAARAARPGLPVIIHDNGIWAPSNIAVTGAARARHLPYVISPHGMLDRWALAYHAGRKKLAWLAYQRRAIADCAGLVATAEHERVAIRALFPRHPVAIIANGIDCPAVPPSHDGQARTVLFMSRIHPVKNLVGLLDAWGQICADPDFADWQLEIAGPDEGGHLAVVQRHAESLGLMGRVRFSGVVADADKAATFARAAVFVLPSFTENFGIVAAEALAAGVPVIASNATPWGELDARGCGWCVAPTPVALAGALRAALQLPPAARRAMGVRGHGWVAAQFSWRRVAGDAAAYYHWLLHGGTVPKHVDA